ncbi:MAG: ATP-binding cassette domain-containing protein [Aliifodinibius sp.]|nr:ABC transporter ATP-binding protein [candidate division Zixibacteria bacterium]NIT55554.1 ABC transporter ATP-binding protein [Fodinibius sp.]NIW43797.1 ATP-binding cassette domain-containing protein [Gammaproteobacteria bacterium]NIS44913.1 ABC transporter ATP-binding protein [candidate division Zixibacteria bacterium]NIU13023.1 ABC transporter ATP-binding protein [candidate division Zixibacteria bacterium]
MDKQSPIISTSDLDIGFPAQGSRKSPTVVASDINVALQGGQVVCLLGPNGSGKSTLIRTLANLHAPLDGEVFLNGKRLTHFAVKEIAQKISTVLTDRITIGNISVYELVAFGRSPYTGWFGSLNKKDEEIVEWAIASAGIEQFVDRDVLHLSDGERQKVMIARALAQDTSAVLLDEPTAHLDLPNRVEIIRLLRKLAHDTQKGILLSTHELDLALKAADTLWLIHRDGKVITGTPEDLVLDGTFESVFEKDSFDFDRSTGSFTLHNPVKAPIHLTGDAVPTFWTRRALEREGYEVVENNGTSLQVEVHSQQDTFEWNIITDEEKHGCSSIKDLLKTLKKIRN